MRCVSTVTECVIALVTVFFATSCSDENYNTVTSTNSLQFTVSVNDAKDVTPEEQVKEAKAVGEAKQLKGVDDSLFISPLYESSFRGGLYRQASKGKKVTTRGTQITALTQLTDIGVSCYNGTTAVFSNIKASKTSGSSENFKLSSEQKNMPTDGGTNVTYYSYQPYNNGSVVYDGYKTIKYTVPTTNSAQPDILYASCTTSATDKTVKLPFSHALTAVKFIVGTDLLSGTISRITLKNIYGYGELDLGTGAWSNLDTQADFSVNGSKAVSSTGAILTDNGEYFMMIPQTLTNATVEIEYSDNYTPNKVLTQSLTGTWNAGTTVTYAIGSSTVKVVNITAAFPYQYTKTTTKLAEGVKAIYPDKSAYSNTDVLGLSIVDKNNKVVLANYPVSYNGTKWTTTGTLLHREGYKYFVYYPYNATAHSSEIPSVGTNSTATNAETFYSPVASKWTLPAVQNTLALLNANDLQTGTGAYNSTTHVVSFSNMRHEFGLYCMLQYKLINTNDPYSFNGDIDPATNFVNSTNKPYYSSAQDRYYYLAKPSSTVNFTFSYKEVSGATKSLSASKNKITAADYLDVDGLVDYQIAASDVYYPDGALSHYGTVYKSKTPFAMVYSNTPNAYEISQGCSHGKALVLMDFATGVPWNVDPSTDQSLLDNWKPKINYTSKANVQPNTVRDMFVADNCGLEEYDKMINNKKYGDGDAFGTVKNYKFKGQGRIYLPSIGEFFRAINTFSKGYLANNTPVMWDCHDDLGCELAWWTELRYPDGSAAALSKAYNSYIEGSGIPSSQYSKLIDGSKSLCYWTSSEFDATHGMALLFGWSVNVWPSGYCSKKVPYYVRAAIAF